MLLLTQRCPHEVVAPLGATDASSLYLCMRERTL